MFDFFDDLSIRNQFIVVAVGLIILFLLVRLNAKNNRNKRLRHKKKDFGDKLREHRKEKEEDQR